MARWRDQSSVFRTRTWCCTQACTPFSSPRLSGLRVVAAQFRVLPCFVSLKYDTRLIQPHIFFAILLTVPPKNVSVPSVSHSTVFVPPKFGLHKSQYVESLVENVGEGVCLHHGKTPPRMCPSPSTTARTGPARPPPNITCRIT